MSGTAKSYRLPKMDTSPFRLVRGELAAPKPRCDAELAILSEIYFGKSLRLSRLQLFGNSTSYEVAETYNSYHGEGFRYSEHSIVGYDHSELFWRHVVGNLFCGGIATHSYGQTLISSHRDKKRLEFWITDRTKKRNSFPRASFVRLARKHGAGENIVKRIDPRVDDVLRSDRVDGALTALSGGVS